MATLSDRADPPTPYSLLPIPYSPTLLTSQGRPSRVWEEEQGVPGCARLTCDLNSCGRNRMPCSAPVRTCLSAC